MGGLAATAMGTMLRSLTLEDPDFDDDEGDDKDEEEGDLENDEEEETSRDRKEEGREVVMLVLPIDQGLGRKLRR